MRVGEQRIEGVVLYVDFDQGLIILGRLTRNQQLGKRV